MLDFENKLKKYGGDFITSLKETSYDDDNKKYMTDSSIEVYNFDKIKETYIKEFL